MRMVAKVLHVAARVLALCALLAGLGAVFLEAVVSATAICVDACSPRDLYFSDLEPIAVRIMTPCAVLVVLALAIFLAYCLASRQGRRAVMSILFFLVGGLVGIAALIALLQYGQATVTVDEGIMIAASAETWAWV